MVLLVVVYCFTSTNMCGSNFYIWDFLVPV